VWQLGGGVISSRAVAHQGPTVGYRIEERGRSLVYLSDHEPFLGADGTDLDVDWVSGGRLAYGADVLLHDAQYTDEEYAEHLGWGHSSIEQAVRFARLARVGQLVLFHHDPGRDDAQLDDLARRAAALWDDPTNAPILAYDGMELTL
jgi:ribonuclease BN (tRNA processing enzyme)